MEMDIDRQKKFEQKIKEGTHDYSTEKDYVYPEDPICLLYTSPSPRD